MTLINIVIESLEDMKAMNVLTLDVKKLTSITNIMVIATGNSNRHVRAIASNVIKTVKEHSIKTLGIDQEI